MRITGIPISTMLNDLKATELKAFSGISIFDTITAVWSFFFNEKKCACPETDNVWVIKGEGICTREKVGRTKQNYLPNTPKRIRPAPVEQMCTEVPSLTSHLRLSHNEQLASQLLPRVELRTSVCLSAQAKVTMASAYVSKEFKEGEEKVLKQKFNVTTFCFPSF